LQKALRHLAALDYSRRFSPSTNPDLVIEYLRQRALLDGPLAIEVVRQSTETGFDIGVRVKNGIDIAAPPTLELRTPDGWRLQPHLQTSVPVAAGDSIEYRVRVNIGPIVVAERYGELERASDRSTLRPWLWAGGAALVVGAAVALIVLTQPDDPVPVAAGPRVVWP
ncbi:MAG: hypothetical protein AAFV29_13185, partial [Myxococcota bacterium]